MIEGDGTVNRVNKLEDMMCKYGQMQPYPPLSLSISVSVPTTAGINQVGHGE